MPGTIAEWYGYRASDPSTAAASSAVHQQCPFVPVDCTKKGGVCSVHPTATQIVSVCPKRMYYNDYEFLRLIADDAFSGMDLHRGSDGLPTLVAGDVAARTAAGHGLMQVGVFGQRWASEVKLPEAMPGGPRYSVDFTLVVVTPTGDLASFAPIEVQSIDTTNSYRQSLLALQNGRRLQSSDFGMNWENVNKRILPQLITKGLILQGERLCHSGIYFVSPEPVYDRIMIRLGGQRRLRRIPRQPGSITFMKLQQDTAKAVDGLPTPMGVSELQTISTSDMSIAFISPENLPPAGSYEAILVNRL